MLDMYRGHKDVISNGVIRSVVNRFNTIGLRVFTLNNKFYSQLPLYVLDGL